jgi:hypothetical protein
MTTFRNEPTRSPKIAANAESKAGDSSGKLDNRHQAGGDNEGGIVRGIG